MQEENWDDLRFVLATARHGSTSVAAEVLGVNESTVARRLARAERAFDTTLFARRAGRLEATDRAADVLDQLRSIDASIERIRHTLTGADDVMSGVVRVTSAALIVNHALLPHLDSLATAHPSLVVELVASTAMLSVTHREADIAIRLERPTTDPDAITRKLGELTYGVYRRVPNPLEQSCEPAWIAFDRSNAVAPQAAWFDTMRRGGDELPIRLSVSDNDTALRCVLTGLGQALLPDAVANLYPELERVPEYEPTLRREVWILSHPNLRRLRRLRETAEWLGARMSAFLEEPRKAEKRVAS